MIDNNLRSRRIKEEFNKTLKVKKTFSKGTRILFYGILCFGLFISLYPFLGAIIASFKTPGQLATLGLNPLPGEGTKENYDYLFNSEFTREYIGTGVKNSIIFSVIVSTLNVFFNFLAGYALARIKFKGKNLILGYLICGMAIPAQVTQVPQLYILISMGFIGGNITDSVGFMGIIFTSMTSAVGIFLVRQFYINQNGSIEEASMMDGLSTFKVFLKISLRMMIPLMATQGAMIFLASGNNFIMFTLWSGGSASRMTITAALQIVGDAANVTDPNKGMAVVLAATNFATMPVIFVYLISLFFQKTSKIGGEK